MKRSTIIILLFLVLIAAAILYYLWRKSEPPAPGPAPSLVSLLPADASYVFYADAAALRSSAFVQKLLVALPSPKEDREYAEFVRRTGFDYTRDLDRVAVAVGPSVEASKDRRDDAVLAVVEGRFDRERIVAYVGEAGKLVPTEGPDVYVFSSTNPREEFTLAFLSENRIALAQGAAPWRTRRLLPREPSALQERVARVAASEFFAVGRFHALPNVLSGGLVSGELRKTLESIQWVTFSLRPSSGQASRPAGETLTVILEAECASPGDARQLAWGLEGLRVLARMALSDPKSVQGMDPALAALLETILKDGKITSADRYARLSFSLGLDFLAALKTSPVAPNKPNR